MLVERLDPTAADHVVMSGLPAGVATCFGRLSVLRLVAPVDPASPDGGCEVIGDFGARSPAPSCGSEWPAGGAPGAAPTP